MKTQNRACIYITIYIYIETKYVCVYDIELRVSNTHNIKPKLDYPSRS